MSRDTTHHQYHLFPDVSTATVRYAGGVVSPLVRILRRKPLQSALVGIMIALGVILISAGFRIRIPGGDIEKRVLRPGEYSVAHVTREGTLGVDHALIRVHAVGDQAGSGQLELRYYRHEPEFAEVVRLSGDEEIVVWFRDGAPRGTIVPVGTIIELRYDDATAFDAVNTFLYRRRIGSRLTALGIVLAFVLAPAWLVRLERVVNRASEAAKP